MGATPVGRIDFSRLTAAPPLHRSTVTAAAGPRPSPHVGGGMQPAAPHTVALSDGTHISFGAVEETPMLGST